MNRIERVNSEIKKQIAVIIDTEIRDPRVAGLVSVVKADTDNDLKTCKVYVSILGAEGKEKDCVKALNNAGGHIRGLLKKRMDIREMPRLTFIGDDSISYGIKISKVLSGLTDKSNDK